MVAYLIWASESVLQLVGSELDFIRATTLQHNTAR